MTPERLTTHQKVVTDIIKVPKKDKESKVPSYKPSNAPKKESNNYS